MKTDPTHWLTDGERARVRRLIRQLGLLAAADAIGVHPHTALRIAEDYPVSRVMALAVREQLALVSVYLMLTPSERRAVARVWRGERA